MTELAKGFVAAGVQPGDRIGLVGRNGAGKTTTLRILAGEGEPYAGSIERTGEIGHARFLGGRLGGLAEAAGGPAFATCAGLVAYAARGPVEAALGAHRVMDEETGSGPFGKIGRWLKANF